MQDLFSRTERLLGTGAMERLRHARVAVFGIGGVGSYAAEALVRGSVGAVDLIDSDTVALSNLNRQLFATYETIGKDKVDAAADRLHTIDPHVTVRTHKVFYTLQTAAQFDLSVYDYIIDAIDTITGKIELVVNADAAKTPIISAMGAGNKLDPTAFRVADIYQTAVCPLAKVMRSALRKRNIRRLKVVYSTELPLSPTETPNDLPTDTHKPIPGSVSFVPPVVGMILAGEVIKDLTGIHGKGRGI